MARTKLWEDTVVLAMRDHQWQKTLMDAGKALGGEGVAKRVMRSPPMPPGLIKLDGKAENKLGDIKLEIGERLFLFEVKSVRNNLTSEWRAAKGTKWSFERLKDLVLCQRDGIASSEAQKMLALSFRCHYAAYWADTGKRHSVNEGRGIAVEGQIEAQSYIAACSTTQSMPELLDGVGMPWPNSFEKEIFRAGVNEPDTETVSFQSLLEGNVKLKIPGSVSQQPAGLEREEFKEYVSFLCGKSGGNMNLPTDDRNESAGEEKIHAVIMSSLGTYFRVLSDTGHLKMLFDGNFRPGPRRPVAQTRYSRSTGPTPSG